MHFPRPLIHVTKLDYNGVEYTAAIEDIPLKPTREEMWVKWREMRERNEAVKVYGVASIDTKAVNNYNEVELLKHQ